MGACLGTRSLRDSQKVDPVEMSLLREDGDENQELDDETLYDEDEEDGIDVNNNNNNAVVEDDEDMAPRLDQLVTIGKERQHKKKETGLVHTEEAWRDAIPYKRPPVRGSGKMFDYNDIVENLETGDIVLFCGVGCGPSLIKCFTFSEWTHLGVVIREKTLDCDYIYLLESTRLDDGLVDRFSGKRGKTGVRVVDLYEMISAHNYCYMGVAKIAWPSADFFHQSVTELWKFIQTDHKKLYESNWMVLARVVVDMRLLGRNDVDTREYFCSELVAEAYKHMGALSKNYNSSECTPDNFFDFSLPLINGVQLHSLMYVDIPGRT